MGEVSLPLLNWHKWFSCKAEIERVTAVGFVLLPEPPI